MLRHWEDQSVATVAQILRISVSAVKMRDARAFSLFTSGGGGI
ncbi:hypothetical protein MTQ08_30985 [Micromonospora sp. R42004]|nr:hypothetical protein [Micromonospora sp. R42004]